MRECSIVDLCFYGASFGGWAVLLAPIGYWRASVLRQSRAGAIRAMLNPDPHGFLYPSVAVVAGLAMIGFGLAPLLHAGDLLHELVRRMGVRTAHAGRFSRRMELPLINENQHCLRNLFVGDYFWKAPPLGVAKFGNSRFKHRPPLRSGATFFASGCRLW
jgi:hypothetical protein